MKKLYISPKTSVIEIEAESTLMNTSNYSLASAQSLDDGELDASGSRSTLWGED